MKSRCWSISRNNTGRSGLQVIGVAIDNKTAVMLFRQSNGMNYPILMGDDDTLELIARYGNSAGALPFTVIIDRSGSIAVRKLGPFNKTELESLIEPLIGPVKNGKSRKFLEYCIDLWLTLPNFVDIDVFIYYQTCRWTRLHCSMHNVRT